MMNFEDSMGMDPRYVGPSVPSRQTQVEPFGNIYKPKMIFEHFLHKIATCFVSNNISTGSSNLSTASTTKSNIEC